MVGWSSHCFQEGVCTLISVLSKPFPKGLVPFGLLHVPFGNMLKVSKIGNSDFRDPQFQTFPEGACPQNTGTQGPSVGQNPSHAHIIH